MNAEIASSAVVEIPTPARRTFWVRFRHQRGATLALAFIGSIGLVAALAPLIAPNDPYFGQLTEALEGPSRSHWLGTDDLGRDLLSRLMLGARMSLLASLTAVAITLAIGLPLGLVAGYARGRTDAALSHVNDTLMSFPPLILAVAVVGILGPSLRNAMIAIGLVYSPRIMRIVRASSLAIREETYILAARAAGVPHRRIIVRHVLPNLLSPLIVETTLAMGLAILAEASLSFLGLGVTPPTPSWGRMLSELRTYWSRIPVAVISVSLAITSFVLAFNVLGEGLRDALGKERR